MINKNIMLIITALISTIYTQQMDAHKDREEKKDQASRQATPYNAQANNLKLSPHAAQTRKYELTKIINKKTGQWYNTEVCREPFCGYAWTCADCDALIAQGYSLIPVSIGTIISSTINDPLPIAIGTAVTICSLACCMKLYDTDRERDHEEILGQWYNARICHDCCTRVDRSMALAAGYACTPVCAGMAASISTSSLLPVITGAAATLLCCAGCARWNDTNQIAREEKLERKVLPYVFTH